MELDPHNHVHGSTTASPRPLKLALGIVAAILIIEIAGGFLSNSLALLSDAGHMFIDALALGLALFAVSMSARPATATRTYGYYRAEILAALANGVILALVSIYIFYEAIQRLANPPEVRGGLLLAVATVGLIANLSMMVILRRSSHQSINVRAAFWHIIGDTISSIGVIVGGIVIMLTGWLAIDPIIAILVGIIILIGAIRLVREAVDILLESVPSDIKIEDVVATLGELPGVAGVHDLHVWTITSGVNALSAHLIISDCTVSESAAIVERVNRTLAERFNISHTTIQLECEKSRNCPSGMICALNRPQSPL